MPREDPAPAARHGLAPAASNPGWTTARADAAPPFPPLALDSLAVRARDSSTFVISPTSRLMLCANQDGLARTMRFVPERADAGDGWTGLRLFGMRKGDPGDRLGLMNGDVALAVDEIAIDSPSAAKLAVLHLCASPSATVHFRRSFGDGGAFELQWRVEELPDAE